MRIAVNLHPLLSKGGAEKVMLAIAATLSREHSVDILTCGPIDRAATEAFFGVELGGVRIRNLVQEGPLWQRAAARILMNRREGNRYKKLFTSFVVSRLSRDYDLFINGESGLLAPNRARYGILYVFFPWREADLYTCRHVVHRLYSLPYLLWARRHPQFSLGSYDLLLTTSRYVVAHVERMWGRKAELLRPSADGRPTPGARRRAILCVGRVFRGAGHDKRLDVLLEAFIQCWKRSGGSCELHVAGFVNDPVYARELEASAKDYPVHFHFNVGREEILRLYGESMVYWHGAGYGQDLERSPEKAEHFGITTVEAMAAGCVPVVFNGGGQPEIVTHGTNGFTWSSPDELVSRTLELMTDEQVWRRMSGAAQVSSGEYSIDAFSRDLHAIVTDVKLREKMTGTGR